MPTAMVSVQSRMTQLEECDPKLYLCSIYASTNPGRAGRQTVPHAARMKARRFRATGPVPLTCLG